MYAIRLSVVWINRLCEPANPAFTMSNERNGERAIHAIANFAHSKLFVPSKLDWLAEL